MVKRVFVKRLPQGTPHLILTLSQKHVKADIVDKLMGLTLVSAHTTEMTIKEAVFGKLPTELDCKTYKCASMEAAKIVGRFIGTRANEKGIEKVRWERPGVYQGKIAAFIEGVREQGLKFI